MATPATTAALDYVGLAAYVVGFLTWAHGQWRKTRREESEIDEERKHKLIKERTEELAAERAAALLAEEHHREAITKLAEELARAKAVIETLKHAP